MKRGRRNGEKKACWYRLLVALAMLGIFVVLCYEVLIALLPTAMPSLVSWVSLPPVVTTLRDTPSAQNWHGLCAENGGITLDDFRAQIEQSPHLQRFYASFTFGTARAITANTDLWMHVTYSPFPSAMYPWSSRKVLIRAGEVLITDREDQYDESHGWLVRGQCCNAMRTTPGAFVVPSVEPPHLYTIPPVLRNPVMPQPSQKEWHLYKPRREPALPYFTPIIMAPVSARPIPYETSKCKFDPSRIRETCLPATVKGDARLFCTKDGTIVRIPLCKNGEEPAPFPGDSGLLPIPEPSTFLLFVTGIVMVVIIGRYYGRRI